MYFRLVYDYDRIAYTFKHTGGTMQAMQQIKSGRGGFRVGAGRKPTGNHKTIPVRVDERLLNFIEWTRKNGVDDVLLQTLEKLQQGDAPPLNTQQAVVEEESTNAPPSHFHLVSAIADLKGYTSHNVLRDSLRIIRKSCKALGFDGATQDLLKGDSSQGDKLLKLEKLLSKDQQFEIFNWIKANC